jgi:hypothetical protein
MATTYEPADKAEAIAERLIEQHHRHLLQARTVWLRTTTGQSKARVCNALLQHAFGKDHVGVFPAFVVVVTDVDWARHRKSREALVDTLLCSMTRQSNVDTGKDRWAIAKPDVSLYLAVVKRHGLNTTEEMQVGRLIKDLPEQLALAMDGDDQDDDEDEGDEGDEVRPGWENAPQAPAVFGSSGNGEYGNQPMSESDWTGKDETPAEVEDPTCDDSWEDATRPDVSPEALSRIRGSVEAGAR